MILDAILSVIEERMARERAVLEVVERDLREAVADLERLEP